VDLNLAGRRALVTGGSRGIGRASAEALAAEGCDLVLVALRAEGLDRARSEILARHNVAVTCIAQDMSAKGAALAVFEAAPDIDILVNNAGAVPPGSVTDLSEDEWRRAWDLKVFGYIAMTRAYLARMKERGSGVIVNVIGVAAEIVDSEYVAGTTGNAGLAAFTRAVGGSSLDFGVRVVGVHPGWVDTDRTAGSPRLAQIKKVWPTVHAIRAAEIASVVAFLASDRASAITGQVVTVDAGMSTRPLPPA
jgi:hypothetical protein